MLGKLASVIELTRAQSRQSRAEENGNVARCSKNTSDRISTTSVHTLAFHRLSISAPSSNKENDPKGLSQAANPSRNERAATLKPGPFLSEGEKANEEVSMQDLTIKLNQNAAASSSQGASSAY